MNFKDRYQPDVWDDLVFGDPQVEYDLRQYAEGKSFNNILLHGPYGSGKTVTAKVLVATSYGQRLCDARLEITDIHHDIESKLQAFADGMPHGFSRTFCNAIRPYAIMNEVDKFTERQQLKLRGIIDEQVNGRFVFTTNNPEKVDRGVLDRCDCYELEIPPPSILVKRAQAICKAEGVKISDAVLQQMIADVGGSLRGTIKGLEKLVLEARP